MKRKIIPLFILSIGVLGLGVWNAKKTVIVLENERSQALFKVQIEVGKQKVFVGIVEANSRNAVLFGTSSNRHVVDLV